jgi:hypothetical protein
LLLIELVYKDHGESYQNHGLLNFEGLNFIIINWRNNNTINNFRMILLEIIKYSEIQLH